MWGEGAIYYQRLGNSASGAEFSDCVRVGLALHLAERAVTKEHSVAGLYYAKRNTQSQINP